MRRTRRRRLPRLMYNLGGRGGGAAVRRARWHPMAAAGAHPPPSAQEEGSEESFSLEYSGPPAFAALIRLTPDLVDEIRRAEEAGGGARIMFNSDINPWENTIDVGGKEFNFAWASEPGLCDIYEERQSGEGGNGLLMERGCAWRKVNVQRILDETAKNTVKMKMSSEEAECRSKS